MAVSGPVVQNPGFGKGHGTDDPASPTRKAASGNAAEKAQSSGRKGEEKREGGSPDEHTRPWQREGHIRWDRRP